MKNFLFVAAVASMVFTGCINEDDTYKKLQPVEKGINIYNWTSSQYSMAAEQANIGLRMAMLVAEAHKQGVENFEDVKIEGISIKGKLLGTSSKIEKTTTGYKITFNPAYMDMDGYSREGAVLIDTGGAPLLEEAVAGKVWSVTFDEKLVLVATNGNTSIKASLVGGSTQLYNDENGAYAISLANQACYLDSGSNFTSNWGGRMTLKPDNMNFTYSDCVGEKFRVRFYGLPLSESDGAICRKCRRQEIADDDLLQWEYGDDLILTVKSKCGANFRTAFLFSGRPVSQVAG